MFLIGKPLARDSCRALEGWLLLRVGRVGQDIERPELIAAASAQIERLEACANRAACVVVLGERNSGKTTIANVLLGDALLPVGVLVNTQYPVLVRYADQTHLVVVTTCDGDDQGQEPRLIADTVISHLDVGLAQPELRDLEVLDTPGGMSAEGALELPYLPRVRIALWCTLASQAWKESERAAWLALAARDRRHGILVVTGVDRIADERDFERLVQRLATEAAPYFAGIAFSPGRRGFPGLDGRGVSEILRAEAARALAHRRRGFARLVGRIERLRRSVLTEMQG